MDEKTVWDKYGAIQKDKPFTLGEYYSYQMRNTPRHILFTHSRYKFAQKMAGENKTILELGCNEGLGSYFLSEFANSVLGVDFDSNAVEWAKSNLASPKISFINDNFLGKKYGEFDTVVSYDVIEHIYADNEDEYMKTVCNNLKDTGILIIGTPNIESRKFSNPEIDGAHVNMYSGQRFKELLNKYFHNVLFFGQNDEMIHTGYMPMCHYLICVCCCKKGVL
ncbi:MAG TPA: class I SAM-dependent methyltransferase [Clostridia bacterium]